MTRISFVTIFLFLSVFFANNLIFADDDCSRKVVCSDGTELITTRCSDSFSIINGRIVDDDSDDPKGKKHHHDDDFYDPCQSGHGHRVNNDSDVPYSLRNIPHHNYDPDDPYGLRQKLHHTTGTILTNQEQ